MKEVDELPIICNGNFKELVHARDCLHMNFRRLKARNLEFEIDNSQTVENIFFKFLQDQRLEWENTSQK